MIPVVERMDYLAYCFNAMAFCGAVETLLEVRGAPRAQYLRVIHLELNRIMSHLVWLGTSALDLGAISMFWYCFRERETILDLFEMSSGQRMHTRYFQVGGVIEDIPKASPRSCASSQDHARTRRPVRRLLSQNEIVPPAPARRCPLDAETLLAFGVTGPCCARRATLGPAQGGPLLLLRGFRFKIPVGTVGDNYDRFAVRLAEIYESVKIIDQALEGLPEGPYITETAKWRCRRATSWRPRWRR